MSSNDRMQQLVDEAPAQNRRAELAFDLVHVVARLEHAEMIDAYVLGRPMPFSSSALTSEPSLNRGGGCVNFCSGVMLFQLQRLAFPQHRQHAVLCVFVDSAGGLRLARLFRSARSPQPPSCPDVDREPARKLRHRALGAEQIVGCEDVDRGVIEERRHHLGADKAIPDQPVEVVLVLRQVRADRVPGGTPSTLAGWLRARPGPSPSL